LKRKWNNTKEDNRKNQANQPDDHRCDNCHETEFEYYCKECSQHICMECDQYIHKRGDRKLHNRIEVYDRQNKPISLCCYIHSDQELRWFCKSCSYSICDKCLDQNDAHKHHDFVLCSTIVNDLKSEVNARYIEFAESKKEPIIKALKTLEEKLYDIGVEGVKTFSSTHNDDNT
jgi:hypothetical protein